MKPSADEITKIAQKATDDIPSMIECWDARKKPQQDLQIGQVVYTPVCQTEFKPKIAEALRSDARHHGQAHIAIRTVDERTDFRHKPSRLPIAALDLGQTEELMLIKGKQRPCVILAKADGVKLESLPAGTQRNKATGAFEGLYCIAPMFSCSTVTKPTSFGPVMGVRIKCMMYPEFIYAPKANPALDVDSVIRLDRIFWSYLRFSTAPKSLMMSDAMLSIAWDQLGVLAELKPSDTYIELRDLLMAEIPKECL